jgi:NAD(P)-dependent dehydrogenase (short-subunit alcohol dehydrogenase family)
MGGQDHAGALVIGGGSGIGAATADLYRLRGTPVTVWDVKGDCDIVCDIGEPDQITRAIGESVAQAGIPRWVTITAGIGHAGLLADTEPEAWDRVMHVNARGPWLCLRGLAAVISESGQPASFVATSSVSAHLVDRNMGLYCASKAALDMIVKVAAAEWGPLGLRVNAIGPGVTQTPMLGASNGRSRWLDAVAERTPAGRLGQATDIAQSILALHDMTWVNGQVLDCDGGLSLHSPIDSYGEVLRRRADRSP